LYISVGLWTRARTMLREDPAHYESLMA
jgi:hypothetical protein